MNQPIKIESKTQSKIVFGLSVFTLFFVLLFQHIDIYKYAFVGVVFELFWFFAVATVFVIPIISLRILLKENFTFKSLYLYALIISFTSMLLLFI